MRILEGLQCDARWSNDRQTSVLRIGKSRYRCNRCDAFYTGLSLTPLLEIWPKWIHRRTLSKLDLLDWWGSPGDCGFDTYICTLRYHRDNRWTKSDGHHNIRQWAIAYHRKTWLPTLDRLVLAPATAKWVLSSRKSRAIAFMFEIKGLSVWTGNL
jgi:hypothetical protein